MLENIALVNLTDIIQEKVKDPLQLRIIKEVASYLLEGMPHNDSCLLARVDPSTFVLWVEEVPEIGQYINIQRLQYKQKLLKTLYTQATVNGDFKIALQLLMSSFPAEFNPAIQKENEKNKRPEGDNTDILREVFSLIQQGESTTVNKEQKTKAQTGEDIKNALSDLLV